MKKSFVLQAIIIFLLFGISLTFGQTISEEARRHFYRGQAAVEMAEAPNDYASAIKEFEQTASLAPDWPEAFYILGLVQEKAGKLKEAVTNLNRYLALAPNARNAAKVKKMLFKLEYKAEQVLTPKDCTDILHSLNDESIWNRRGDEITIFQSWDKHPKRMGENILKVIIMMEPTSHGKSLTFDSLKVDGDTIKTRWIVYLNRIKNGETCYYITGETEIKIVSWNRVRAVQTLFHAIGSRKEYLSCEFERKTAR